MSVIEVKNIVKEYRLGQLKSFKKSLFDTVGRLLGKDVEERKNFRALDDVSFSVEKGEVLGIIGKNGAGKSTLLKILAQISTPSQGSLKVDGSVAPLIEVGAGLHPELTGRENIFLNATILGISRSEIKDKLDEIIEFAGLEEFIDTPVKRYSSGMTIRLGFSIATSVESDILIVDEVLAVGDLAFQRKCYDRMEDLIKKRGKTVLIVGHNIRQMERMCSRILLMDKGRVLMDGEPTAVCNAYYHNMSGGNDIENLDQSDGKIIGLVDAEDIKILDISLFSGGADEPADMLEMHESMRVGVRFEVFHDLPSTEIIIGIHTPDFIYVTMATSAMEQSCPDFNRGIHYFECHFSDLILKPGSYSFRLAFFDKFDRMVWYGQNLKTFRVRANDGDSNLSAQTQGLIGLVELPMKWHFSEPAKMREPASESDQPDKGLLQ
jgi:ABC-type polysaccharide/polyol phosphate transport system ATPase subunit